MGVVILGCAAQTEDRKNKEKRNDSRCFTFHSHDATQECYLDVYASREQGARHIAEPCAPWWATRCACVGYARSAGEIVRPADCGALHTKEHDAAAVRP